MREPLGREALVFSLYDAAQDPRQWGPVASQLANALRSGSAAFLLRSPDQVRVLSRTRNFSDEDDEAYRTYYHSRDVLVGRAALRGLNQVLASSDLISDREWTESEVYRDYFLDLGVHQLIGGVITLPGDDAQGVLSVHRDTRGKQFNAQEKAFLNSLLPHLRNAIKIQRSLSTHTLAQHAAGSFLERSNTALLVVDRAGRLLMASTKGESLLQRAAGLTVIGGRVVASQTAAHQRLLRLIEIAVDTAAGRGDGAGGMVAIPAEHQPPLSVTVAPLRPQRDGIGLREPVALLLVRDPGERVEITPMLQDLFGLSRSEALLANGLVNGLSIHEVALAHDVTLNTIRTQLKSVLTKTSTSRQTELVALILRCIAGQL